MNMNKQYRAEIRLLKKSRAAQRAAYIAEERSAKKAFTQAMRDLKRIRSGRDRTLSRMDNRIALLQGRLS
jgi:hypothetical protein